MELLSIGETVGYGRYRLVRQLGRGSFGDVFLAELLGPGGHRLKDVVLKVLHRHWAQNREVVVRFQREWMAAMRVEHDHVARVIEHGLLEEDVPFICMEYLVGRSLRAEILRGAFPAPRALSVLVPVTAALAAAHASGVVHRDLKPDNIFLIDRSERNGSPDHPMLLDFGVAKLLSDASQITKTGALLGTPVYMAPEQFLGDRALGPPADIYALGVIAFEICTGQPPFLSESFETLALAHTAEEAPQLKGVPRALTRLVASCLRKDPTLRPTAQDLLKALQALQPPAPPASNPPRPSRAHAVVPPSAVSRRGTTGTALTVPGPSRPPTGSAVAVRGRLPLVLVLGLLALLAVLALLSPRHESQRPRGLPAPLRR